MRGHRCICIPPHWLSPPKSLRAFVHCNEYFFISFQTAMTPLWGLWLFLPPIGEKNYERHVRYPPRSTQRPCPLCNHVPKRKAPEVARRSPPRDSHKATSRNTQLSRRREDSLSVMGHTLAFTPKSALQSTLYSQLCEPARASPLEWTTEMGKTPTHRLSEGIKFCVW